MVAASGMAAALMMVGCGHAPAAGSAEPAQPVQRAGGGGVEIAIDPSLKEAGTLGPWTIYGIALAGSAKATGHIGDYAGELTARTTLARVWKEKPTGVASARQSDGYLDAMAAVDDAGLMSEYVVSYLARPGWVIPADDLRKLKLAAFMQWIPTHLGGLHRPQTRVRVRSAAATPLPVPGAALATMGAQDPRRVPCQELAPDLTRALAVWAAEAAQLSQMAISAMSAEELLPTLERAARDARAQRDGVVLVSPSVATTFFLAGFCAVERGAFSEAEHHLRGAVALAPSSTNIRGELVQTLIVPETLRRGRHRARRGVAVRGIAVPCRSPLAQARLHPVRSRQAAGGLPGLRPLARVRPGERRRSKGDAAHRERAAAQGRLRREDLEGLHAPAGGQQDDREGLSVNLTTAER